MRFEIALAVTFIIGSLGSLAAKDRMEVKSPDGNLEIRISQKEKIYYSVFFKGAMIVSPSPIGLMIENSISGSLSPIRRTSWKRHHDVIRLPYGNSNTLDDHYNELQIDFEDGSAIILRAYNEGVAYRFKTNEGKKVRVINEEFTVNLTGNYAIVYPETNVFTSWEVPYIQYADLASVPSEKRALTPALFYKGNLRILVAEADVIDYPGMYLQKTEGTIKGVWAPYPKRTELGSWGNFVSVVKETENFIAETNGDRTFPWRVIIPTDDDRTLLANDLIYKLAKPLAIGDASWVKPGKAAWEWWHDAIVEDAGIPSGMANRNTELYKHYIDFASNNHLQYLMVDAGWSDIFDLSKVNPRFDVHAIIRYGKEKNVDIFLWCVATTLVKDLDRYMNLMREWGVAGLKVDFIDRDDQLAIRWFEEIAAAAAKRKLMIDFHGCSKPTGLERAYPNIVNYEAVRGAECSKWDLTANPDQHLLTPFIRMVAGPLDYTPGSMRNKTKDQFKPIDPGLPSTQGTRCHELAMYVVLDQPFAMLCDAPAEYRKYPDIMRYLSAVPTSFDETKVLQAKLGEHIVMAKRKDKNWFVGAMTNWNARDLEIDFSFLPPGVKMNAELYTDTKASLTDASQYGHKTISVTQTSKLKISLAQGGGAVVYLHP
jgi:alpha-glucosidase